MTKVFEDLLENEHFSLYFLINLSNQKKTIVKWGVLARPGKSFFLPKLLQRHRAVGSHHVDRAHYYHYYVLYPKQNQLLPPALGSCFILRLHLCLRSQSPSESLRHPITIIKHSPSQLYAFFRVRHV